MEKILETITLKDITYFVIGTITIFSILVEKIGSLPFNPWSSLFNWIGKKLNKDTSERLDLIEEQQRSNNNSLIELEKRVEQEFRERQKDADTKEAKRLRLNIIQFADSCRVGEKHTQNHFENVFRDYTDYVDLCDKNDIPNHFIDTEYAYIREIYSECLKENKFI